MPDFCSTRRHGIWIAAAVVCLLLCPSVLPAAEPDAKKLAEKTKEIAGVAEFLRSVPKHFATLKSIDASRRKVTLLVDGESLAKEWDVAAEAEVKVAGWWGRLDQLTQGDRVWVWFQTTRAKQPSAISMLADELSEQDMHGPGVTLEARADGTITVKPVVGSSMTLGTADGRFHAGPDQTTLADLPVGSKLYLQSAGGKAQDIYTPAAFETRRSQQKAALRKRWLDDGLPGTVVFLHRFSGEMDYVLDHEAMRWGRSLKPGDKVTFPTTSPITGVVKRVQPWREHTELRLVVAAADQADLSPGQRLPVRMAAPDAAVENSALPPDLERPRTKEERVEWFLASIYCTCQVKGNHCTGQFYTLASCNPNGCGMPNHMRRVLGDKIAKGLTDKQIFEDLLQENGPDLVRPHLLP
jgi:hypothetical protein